MLGIIATIIAAVKGHKTFAWVIGVWSAIEIVLLLSKSPYAVGPGGLFVIIALCMSNLNKKEKDSGPQEQKTSNHYSSPSVFSAPSSSLMKDTEKNVDIEPVAPLLCDMPGYVDCPLCHTRQRVGREKCFGCNVCFLSAPIKTVEINSTEATLSSEPIPSEPVSIETEETYLETAAFNSEENKQPVEPPAFPKVRFCRKCGFELFEGSGFCSHCGTKIEIVPQAETAGTSVEA